MSRTHSKTSAEEVKWQRREKVGKVTAKLHSAQPQNKSELALLGFLVGAAYSLDRAIRFEHREVAPEKIVTELTREFQDVAKELSCEEYDYPTRWQAGFYFNSAILRLNALARGIAKYAATSKDLGGKVTGEAKLLYDDTLSALDGERTLDLDDAIALFETLTDWFCLLTKHH